LEGARVVSDSLDVILVDPTIQTQTLLRLHRRILLALRARGVDEALLVYQ